MAVTIRMTRKGRSKLPFYRVVAADHRMRRDGRFLEQLGTYDPLAADGGVKLDLARINHWVAQGATVSETVQGLIQRASAQAS